MESALNPIYTGKDVVQILMGIGYDMRRLSSDNFKEVMTKINERGAWLCQILSSK